MTIAELRQLYELLSKYMEGNECSSSTYEYGAEVRRRVADRVLKKEGGR